MTLDELEKVPVEKAYRLLNIGPTVLVSTGDAADGDVMAAAWASALDYDKVSVVIDRTHYTRGLIEKTGHFVMMVPTAKIAELVMMLGTVSKNDDPDKMAKAGSAVFYQEGVREPLIEGCMSYLVCRVLDEPEMAEKYDLFLGKVEAAYSDPAIVSNGHFRFENFTKAEEGNRSLHYVAGGHFYAVGEALDVPGYDE